MYTLLIVDNERIIVDGLVAHFTELQESLNIDVYGAYSGKGALQLLEKTKIDIVLSDIQMPGMSGLELHEEMTRLWPRCKFIFLSGHDDFSYVQQAVRGGASNYILKTEGYDVITQAVHRVVEELKEIVKHDSLLTNAKNQLQQSLQLMQKEVMEEILLGEPLALMNLESNLEQLDIKLNSSAPLLLVVGRIDEWRDITAPSERALIKFAIQNIAEEYLSPFLNVHSFSYEPSRLIWLLQVKGDAFMNEADRRAHAVRFVHQTLGDIQQTCKELLKVTLSFAAAGSLVNWKRLSEQFESLKSAFQLGLGIQKETIYLENPNTNVMPDEPVQKQFMLTVNNQIRKLQNLLENGDGEAFIVHLTELLNEADETLPVQEAIRLEIALSLSNMLMSAINRWGLQKEINQTIDLRKLLQLDVQAWKACTAFYYQLAKTVFEIKSDEKMNQEQSIVSQIQSYIDEHLTNDLSLTKIGEAFGHNPYYLSRLYKQITGVGLAEYISEIRLMRAKQLLKESDRKVNDIAKEIGFISEAYFYRFFKKSIGITPQEYRDS
ncbi:response regulator [Paenibacillus albus]|uniref:Response regulator n=1 Tax=Paenibacillus albus TaxID=2495582 RepID=A0A3Q8X799_9BACL|nr:response regulator [Paenibacillus albus]AZN41664.1 response regulator [Paenibacillus albus]